MFIHILFNNEIIYFLNKLILKFNINNLNLLHLSIT